ncbi:hypothetical protein FPRO03_00042 [Fusarium proliferatum]|nr:hypothetical protein FPRO03_00042 [Fusarium proliferatum]
MTSETIVESRTHDDYHVGWVCALPTEQTAAMAMLDHRHADLPKLTNDNNAYTLGSIGKHYVVIACLPKGKTGNVSAATVATNMVSTFPNIRFCLMVGIGGGIPPKVRLGDVVVSTPVGAFPGIVQYDLGKAHQGESEHDLTGSRIPDYLKELEQKWPRLAHKYLKSDSLKDQLFKTEYAHISKSVGEGTADGTVIRVNDHEAEESDAEDDCRFCDKSQTVKRKHREMRVHYGLIASGNEASDVEREPTAKEVLSQIHETVTRSDANIREVKRKMDRKEDVEILEWLTPVNYGPQQSDTFSQRQEGTGEWLLSSKEFQDWIDTGKTLFCPGVPGAGKTILTSIVINELMTRFGDDDTVGIAFIYGNYRQRDEQRLDHLLKSLLKQLVQGQSSIPASVKSLYDKHKVSKTRPSSEEISTTLQSVVALFTRVHIIVDALDELNAIDGCRNRFLEEILKVQAQGSAKFFATSRFIPEITDKFGGGKTIKIRAQDEDVRSFLDSKISQSGKLLQTHREMIKSEIAKAVDGMFLLAQLHFQYVSTKKTLKKIKDALNSLSGGSKAYDIAYKKAMERIAGQDQDSKELAMQVLSWITGARRVLTILELQHALAVERDHKELDEENVPRIDDMISVCSGLVAVGQESGVIRLVHYTTEEYLDRTRNIWFSNSDLEIAMTCITYLSFDVFRGDFCKRREEYKRRLRCHPFYYYAHRNWGHHALMASMDGDRVILDFLEGPVKLSASVQAIMASEDSPWTGSHIQDFSHIPTEVPTTAYFGLWKTVSALLEAGHAADSRGLSGWTPLSYAARYGHEEVVKLLISRNDVDPNSEDKWLSSSPLSLAAENGHSGVVKVFIEKEGVLADHADFRDMTPLSKAARYGHEAVVRLLLSKETVDANRKGSWSRLMPLDYAVKAGHERIVALLLTKTNVTWDWGSPGSAAWNGRTKIPKLVMDEYSIANRQGQERKRILELLKNSIPDRQGMRQKAMARTTGKQDESLHCATGSSGDPSTKGSTHQS